jgi:hypothetical protein
LQGLALARLTRQDRVERYMDLAEPPVKVVCD